MTDHLRQPGSVFEHNRTVILELGDDWLDGDELVFDFSAQELRGIPVVGPRCGSGAVPGSTADDVIERLSRTG